MKNSNNTYSYITLKTSLVGKLLLVANATHLVGIYFDDSECVPASRRDWKLDPKHPVLRQAAAELEEYLNGDRTTFTVPLHYAGTGFQHEIWRQISLIPFGQTISYSELAQRAGAPSAIRAAGTATGDNPLCLIIPCHRVVAKNGGLGGFGGGLERKRRLLNLETTGKHKPAGELSLA